MAKQKPTTHQALVTHSPSIEAVRTHIRAHCESEPLIKQLLNTLDLTQKEFDEVFKSHYLDAPKTKKKASTSGKENLRVVVGAHLHHLLCLSKFKDFKEKLKSKRMQQKEIQHIIAARPEIAFQEFDFSKNISPEQALSLLSDLETKTAQLEEEIFNTLAQHEQNIESFTQKRKDLLNSLAKDIKLKDRALSTKELSYLFKAVSELTA